MLITIGQSKNKFSTISHPCSVLWQARIHSYRLTCTNWNFNPFQLRAENLRLKFEDTFFATKTHSTVWNHDWICWDLVKFRVINFNFNFVSWMAHLENWNVIHHILLLYCQDVREDRLVTIVILWGRFDCHVFKLGFVVG